MSAEVGSAGSWLQRVALRSCAWSERWIPDAYVFAALAVVIVGSSPSFASFETVFHWQAALGVLTAVLAIPVDTRPR